MQSVKSDEKLPEIKMVRHARAKNLRLRVDPTGIRLTVPLFCSQRQIQMFLNQSEQWLIEIWEKQQKQNPKYSEFPEHLQLFYHSKPFSVIQQSQRMIFKFDWENNILHVKNDQIERALQSAVLSYSKEFLPIFLNEMSREIGLSFRDCSIRKPKTRWGSCSSQHDIMLNAGLVLMPEYLVRSVCIHELVHTVHFDHSAVFWAEVEKHDPNYLENRRQLKNNQLPAWWYVK
ncbi:MULTISPECIES: M48 family metallopeptidase [Acinetobacter]|uniref:YgjP-like metallopeptidase domain-containing protein n=1 Tax=Acinetobacter junii TaxID=40215 RepID=A0A365PJL3_ACIJU|nr:MULTISPECIES: SprT family zinc-dependent metalloprotease [Acinetobacter]RBA32594.1 hypothetical protein DDF86_12860 [Acinetobacter junii]RBA42447.1 hypothetical protein DDG62_02720 [Acinetobacter junii]RBA48367.1 hypothetical protein DC346_07430 [Acinetobacter junii]WLF73924.1 SprT family zinc-dependent metalloprotease [Acinetobacter junii]